MVKCPFCGFANNEDGALFCEQCRSDISSVTPVAASPSSPPPTPMPDSLPAAEEPIMAAIVEDAPIVAVEEPMVAVMVDEPAPATIEAPPAMAAVVEEPPAVSADPVVAPSGPANAAGMTATPAAAPALAAAAPAPTAPAAAATTAPAPAKPAASGTPIAPGAQVKLVVQRGLKVGEEYNVFGGENFIGRADEKPVDVDLTFQEPEDRVWCSRQHALMVYDEDTGTLTIEDLNSANGTFVNRERVYPGQPKQLFVGSTVQIGTVHLKVKA